MVRVGEDQAILTLERIHALGYHPKQQHHYGAEPSFHRSASESIPALVLVRA